MPYRPDQQQRGFSPVYRANEVNHCPGCGRTHWYVGRLSAECGCPKTPCGLTEFGTWDPDCDFHGPTKTMRQGHAPEDCPGYEGTA